MYVQTTCMLLCRLMLSTLRLSMTELPLHLPRLLLLPQLRPAPVSLAEPADAGDITGGHVVPARQQKQKVHHLLFASSITHFCKVPAAFTVLVLVMSSSKRQTAACLIKLFANVWLFINHLVQGVLACFPLPL